MDRTIGGGALDGLKACIIGAGCSGFTTAKRLKDAGRQAEWGVGRHVLGSQVFDYWRDPWGHTLEHWTDGDLFTAADGSNIASLQDLLGVQWGPQMPPTMG